MTYFDTHSHLTLTEKHFSIDKQIELAQQNNVSYIFDPGISIDDFLLRFNTFSIFSMAFSANSFV